MKSIPQRMCVGCREMKEKRHLMRVLRTPEGEILLDATGKKSGRGAYLCPQEECLRKAMKSKSLERALKSKISEEIFAAIKMQLPGT
ncbi:MAG: YlxR family protein [Clostridiales bacterium]|nr:YlxR family protein [Clostridiales bacterium]